MLYKDGPFQCSRFRSTDQPDQGLENLSGNLEVCTVEHTENLQYTEIIADTFLHEFWGKECAHVESGDGVELSVVGDGGGDGARQVQRLRDDLMDGWVCWKVIFDHFWR